tara:strand:+ start:5396 stop:6232 length:837 start_codon:yes stop_codon:yes gene_type:complete
LEGVDEVMVRRFVNQRRMAEQGRINNQLPDAQRGPSTIPTYGHTVWEDGSVDRQGEQWFRRPQGAMLHQPYPLPNPGRFMTTDSIGVNPHAGWAMVSPPKAPIKPNEYLPGANQFRSGKGTVPNWKDPSQTKIVDTSHFGDTWGGTWNQPRKVEHVGPTEDGVEYPSNMSRYTEFDRISDRFKKYVPPFEEMTTEQLYKYAANLFWSGVDTVGEGDEANYDFKAWQEEMDRIDVEIDKRRDNWKDAMREVEAIVRTKGKVKKDDKSKKSPRPDIRLNR